MGPDPQRWIKAAKSGANSSCVEMRRSGEAVEVRDSKQAGRGPTLAMMPVVFEGWLSSAKSGVLDRLVDAEFHE